MPIIPTYQRRMSIPSEGPNALQDVGSAGLVGNSIARMGNVGAEFIGLIQHQQEDLRKRRATVENSRLTNSANNFLTNQKIEFDTNANTMDSSINLASYAGQHEESIKPTFKSLIKFDEITDPDVSRHAQILSDTVDAHFRDHTAVAQQKALGGFASKEIDTGGLNAIAMARTGITPEESMKSAAEIIQNMHNTGVINTDKASEFTVKIQQQVVSNYMESLSVSDPKKYIEVVKSGKYNNIMSTADYNHGQEKAKSLDEKQRGTDAFNATLEDAAALPDVKSGKVTQMEGAQKLWMNPTIIKKHGITDTEWRAGMLNFDHALKFRDEQDEKSAGDSTVKMSEKFNKHQLQYSDVDAAFTNITNPTLKAKFVEHWAHLLDQQTGQIRSIVSAERTAVAGERAAKAAEEKNNPFNKDNPEIKARLLGLSVSKPFTPGLLNEINLAHGNGLSTNTYDAAIKNIRSADVWKAPTGKELYKMIATDKRNNAFSTNDSKNNERYAEELQYFSGILQKKPDTDFKTLSTEYDARKKKAKQGTISKLLDEYITPSWMK